MSAGLRARKTWRTLEPLHGMVYFVPEASAAYARLGITGQAGYFASRAAPLGEVGPDVVVSTFYNFNPDVVAAAIPSAWEAAPPAAWLRARLEAADGAIRRILGDAVLGSADMARAASLARLAAEDVTGRCEGRPLAAAHAALSWPEEPHLALWHAQSVLREYRGDGHVALLVTHGLSGLEALVSHAASGDVPAPVLRSTRQWPEDSVAEGGRIVATSPLARAWGWSPLDGVGRGTAPGDRGRDGRVVLCPLRGAGRRRLCRAAGPRTSVEPNVRGDAFLR